MAKRASAFLTALGDLPGVGTRQAEIYQLLRRAILDGTLRPRARLLSTRDFARTYDVSRGTVTLVYEQLAAEGYICGRRGSGTYVSDALPEALLRRPAVAPARARLQPAPRLAARAKLVTRAPFPLAAAEHVGRAFAPHQPALDQFPEAIWSRVASRALRRLPLRALADGASFGYRPLREAIATYLGAERGVRCAPEQVLIVSGTQQALDLAARLLLDPGDEVWVEDPGYPGARAVLAANGAVPRAVPVDADGLRVDDGERLAAGARLAHVTPAHQAPLGVVMSAARRLQLLAWARRRRAWLFEDDYDSEFRYHGRPLPALHALDDTGCVLHAGTFSKTLFPALRVGYLVVPDALVDAFARARALVDRYPSIVPQAILSHLIAEGHYARHLRRMRALYAERYAALHEAVANRIGDRLVISGDPAGLDVVGWLRDRTEQQVVAAAARRDLVVAPLSGYAFVHRMQPGLLLGFAMVPPRQLGPSVERLAAALTDRRS